MCVEILIRVTELKSVKQSVKAEAFKLYYLQWEHARALGSELCQSAPPATGGSPENSTARPVCWGNGGV